MIALGTVRRFFGSRIILLVCLGLVVCFLDTGYQFIQTLRVLDLTERLRDQWQRPTEILTALHLKEGSTVAELGCGAGYFELKLAPLLGKTGNVFAEDIASEPLVFLWIRARSRGLYNIHVLHGTEDDPHLPTGVLDAVLIANTYHEFRQARSILIRTFVALRAGGRLVIVDRGPLSTNERSREIEAAHHEVTSLRVEAEVLEAGFSVISRQDNFIEAAATKRPGDRPDNHPWWMITAYKPMGAQSRER